MLYGIYICIYIYIIVISYYVVLLHYISCVQKWLFLFYAVLLRFDSLIMIHCELKHVGIFSMIL